MSDNRSDEAKDSGPGDNSQIGLSLPGEEARQRPKTERGKRETGAQAKLRRAADVDQNLAMRWFLPVTIVLFLMLILLASLLIAQGSRLDTLQRRVAEMSERLANTDADTAIEQLRTRIDALDDRLEIASDIGSGTRALEQTVTEQSSMIEKLADRLDELEQASQDTGAESDATAAGAPPSTQSAGSWVVNLITVADRASAEDFQKRLDELRVKSRIQSVTIEGKSLLRVVVPGFQSQDDAKSAGTELKQQLELSDEPWIARQ